MDVRSDGLLIGSTYPLEEFRAVPSAAGPFLDFVRVWVRLDNDVADRPEWAGASLRLEGHLIDSCAHHVGFDADLVLCVPDFNWRGRGAAGSHSHAHEVLSSAQFRRAILVPRARIAAESMKVIA